MQPTDVYSVQVGSNNLAFESQAVNGRSRLKGIYVCGGVDTTGTSGGKVQLRDGTTNTDTARFEFQCPRGSTVTGGFFIKIPGNGILFESGIFVDAEAAVNPVTLVFQGGAAA
tara:strand:+ start:830 stop:1168 length:339 start_codon:yes stop_codon:yes gene_type:complete